MKIRPKIRPDPRALYVSDVSKISFDSVTTNFATFKKEGRGFEILFKTYIYCPITYIGL